MRAFFLATILFLGGLFLSGCQPSQNGTTEGSSAQDQSQNQSTTLLRIAMIGDGEPKPLAEFPNMAAAITQINDIHDSSPFDFVLGVGDIAHKGTQIQYEAATAELTRLEPPFYPIMGNEERESTVERYLEYASQWNEEVTQSDTLRSMMRWRLCLPHRMKGVIFTMMVLHGFEIN